MSIDFSIGEKVIIKSFPSLSENTRYKNMVRKGTVTDYTTNKGRMGIIVTYPSGSEEVFMPFQYYRIGRVKQPVPAAPVAEFAVAV